MTTLGDSLASVDHVGRGKIIARNTFRYAAPDGAEVTRLHATDVVTRLPDGRVKLDSGGWRTITTKDRINRFAAPYVVISERGLWFVADLGGGGSPWNPTGPRVPFYDGITLPDAFAKPAKGAAELKRQTKLKGQIKAYGARIAAMPRLPQPNGGDCWFCLMRDQGTGKAWGDASGNTDHLLSHLKEGYAPGALIVNAMKDAGFRDEGIAWAFRGAFPRERVVKAVTRYLKRKLGVA